MTFAAVFSLGSNCTPAHQLRRYFGAGSRSCFDWLITPLRSIERILADDGAGFCSDVSECYDGASAFCERYGVLYHHEFRPHGYGHVVIDEAAKERARSKMLYKYNKMVSLARGHRTLFLRYGSGTDAPGDNDAVTDREMVDLVEVLKAKLDHDNFEVCYIRQEGFQFERSAFSGRAIGNCSFHSATHTPGALGIDAEWDALFASKGLDRSAPPLV